MKDAPVAEGILIGLFLLFCLGGALGFCRSAAAHEWYPQECCSDHDCAPIPPEQLTHSDRGWLWKNENGERLFPFNSPDLRASPDGRPHGCEYEVDDGPAHHTSGSHYKRCLFVSGGTS